MPGAERPKVRGILKHEVGFNSSGAKSSSSYRLRITWDNIKDRQEGDKSKHDFQTPSLAKQVDPYAAPEQNVMALMDADPELDKQEGVLIALEQRRKFKAARKGLKKKYEEVEDTIFESRRPPLLRTTGGEVIQGHYPAKSATWLGVQPRFGSTVPTEKYVGAFANEFSKWLSTDKLTRLKEEASVENQPVRGYLKIDDSIDIKEMTGSHFRYFDNPLDDDLMELRDREKRERQLALLAAEAGSSRDGSLNSADRDQPDAVEDDEDVDEAMEDEDQDEYEDEYDDEYEDDDGSETLTEQSYGSSQASMMERRRAQRAEEKAQKRLADATVIFERHVNKLSNQVRREMRDKLEAVEEDWRHGQATRPATLRFRR